MSTRLLACLLALLAALGGVCVPAHADPASLYVLSTDGDLYNVDRVINGTGPARQVRARIPSPVGSDNWNYLLSLAYANGQFYAGAQRIGSYTGQIYSFGFDAGDQAHVGSLGTGKYWPHGLATDSNGDVYVSFSSTLSPPTCSGGFSNYAQKVGRISLSTGAVDDGTVETSSDTLRVYNMQGISFFPDDALLALHRNCDHPLFRIVDFDTASGTVSPYCGSTPCWHSEGNGDEPLVYDIAVNPDTEQIVVLARGPVINGHAGIEFYEIDISDPTSLSYTLLGGYNPGESFTALAMAFGPPTPSDTVDYYVIDAAGTVVPL